MMEDMGEVVMDSGDIERQAEAMLEADGDAMDVQSGDHAARPAYAPLSAQQMAVSKDGQGKGAGGVCARSDVMNKLNTIFRLSKCCETNHPNKPDRSTGSPPTLPEKTFPSKA
jgi:hypothetical protein